LFGATGGSDIIPGADYLKVGYDLDIANLWRLNLTVLIGFFIAFQVAQYLALEYYPQYGYNASVNIYAPDTDEIRALNEEQVARRQRRDAAKEKGDAFERKKSDVAKKHEGRCFTWENLNYHVPSPGGGTLRLLHDINGFVKPGTLTALMGASGAGKTTCLDVLAQRKNIGVVSGDILVDGRPLPLDFARGTAYGKHLLLAPTELA
jgi:ATP-binding cassette, subfamily G (WHITE), member 2, SNQ2